jgi:hypothetical protein
MAHLRMELILAVRGQPPKMPGGGGAPRNRPGVGRSSEQVLGFPCQADPAVKIRWSGRPIRINAPFQAQDT